MDFMGPMMQDPYGLKAGEVSSGTTIMGVVFDGGIVLGADTRTSTGQYVANRASRKISQVAPHIFLCRSGSAADTQALTNMVKNYLGQHTIELGEEPYVETAANLFRMIAYNNKDMLSAAMILGGVDKQGAKLYSIPLGGTLYPVEVYASGSGSTYVQGLIDATYRKGMTRSETEAFVAKTISHAMARDGSSGGMLRLVTITKDSVEEQHILGNELPYGP
jgi:20S proteasome subunit beta 1